MNTKLRQKQKMRFEKKNFELMNNAVFGKNMENLTKHRNTNLVTRERRRNYLVSDRNYCNTNFFTENLFAVKMRKTQILMKGPVYLSLPILDLSKTVIYEFWYDYVTPKHGGDAKLCHMNTDSFNVHVKLDDIYKDIAENVETRFISSNCEIDMPLTKEKIKAWPKHERICCIKSKVCHKSKTQMSRLQKLLRGRSN